MFRSLCGLVITCIFMVSCASLNPEIELEKYSNKKINNLMIIFYTDGVSDRFVESLCHDLEAQFNAQGVKTKVIPLTYIDFPPLKKDYIGEYQTLMTIRAYHIDGPRVEFLVEVGDSVTEKLILRATIISTGGQTAQVSELLVEDLIEKMQEADVL